MKLSRYFEFVNENFELILESDVVYSDKFRKVLMKMENPLAKKLLGVENKDFPVQNNFFDITDANDTISFIQDRRAQEMMTNDNEVECGREGGRLSHNMRENGEIFKALGYEPKGESAYSPDAGEKGKVIKKTISPTSGNTYVYVKFEGGEGVYNQNVLKRAGEDDVWKKQRQSIRIGRGIRTIISASKIESPDKEIEEFVNKYKATLDNMNNIFTNFEVVSGDKIAYWYDYHNYEEEQRRGQLGNSCMSAADDIGWFDIYTQNPDKVNMAIYKCPDNPSKIKGRALVWKLDDGKTFMDRIYTHDDSDVDLFRQYATKNGWYYKRHNQSTSSGEAIGPDGDPTNLNLVVTLKKINWDHYPYLDTLKYYRPKLGILSNEQSGEYLELEDTDGHTSNEGCDDCDGTGRVDCDDCDGDGEWECNECDGTGKEDCGDCDGSGKVDCDTCDGGGEVDGEKCSDCDGSGKVDCEECENGKVECDDCDGKGKQECDNCNGNGRVDCPECS